MIVGNTEHALTLLNSTKGGAFFAYFYRVYFAVCLYLFIGLVTLAPWHPPVLGKKFPSHVDLCSMAWFKGGTCFWTHVEGHADPFAW